MKYTLTDPNGNVLLSVESTPVKTEADMKADLDKAAKACESAFDEVTKYQDAMAVMSSEGFGEQAKAVAEKVKESIIKFCKSVKEWFKRLLERIKAFFQRLFGGNKNKQLQSAKVTKVENIQPIISAESANAIMAAHVDVVFNGKKYTVLIDKDNFMSSLHDIDDKVIDPRLSTTVISKLFDTRLSILSKIDPSSLNYVGDQIDTLTIDKYMVDKSTVDFESIKNIINNYSDFHTSDLSNKANKLLNILYDIQNDYDIALSNLLKQYHVYTDNGVVETGSDDFVVPKDADQYRNVLMKNITFINSEINVLSKLLQMIELAYMSSYNAICSKLSDEDKFAKFISFKRGQCAIYHGDNGKIWYRVNSTLVCPYGETNEALQKSIKELTLWLANEKNDDDFRTKIINATEMETMNRNYHILQGSYQQSKNTKETSSAFMNILSVFVKHDPTLHLLRNNKNLFTLTTDGKNFDFEQEFEQQNGGVQITADTDYFAPGSGIIVAKLKTKFTLSSNDAIDISGHKLYHISPVNGLTKLLASQGSKTNFNAYSTSRIYFSLDKPVNAYDTSSFAKDQTVHVYEFIDDATKYKFYKDTLVENSVYCNVPIGGFIRVKQIK